MEDLRASTLLLDALIERLPQLREQGVTHFSFEPKTGAISMLLAPKPAAQVEAEQPVLTPYNDPSAYGLEPGTPMPRSFKERRASAAPAVK